MESASSKMTNLKGGHGLPLVREKIKHSKSIPVLKDRSLLGAYK